jgi:uncharacterized protein (DUF433 family)
MAKEYVERREAGYWIAGTRVSLDSIVYAFLRGSSPESIAQSFPALTLEEVYGGITFYLAHQAEVDALLQQTEVEFSVLEKESREANSPLHKKLREAREIRANRR